MNVQFGKGQTQYGPGVEINLTGNEVALAIYTYLTAHNVHIDGAATILVNNELCTKGEIYIDPCSSAIVEGERWKGNGTKE